MLATGRPATDRDSSAAGASGSTTLYEYLKRSIYAESLEKSFFKNQLDCKVRRPQNT